MMSYRPCMMLLKNYIPTIGLSLHRRMQSLFFLTSFLHPVGMQGVFNQGLQQLDLQQRMLCGSIPL